MHSYATYAKDIPPQVAGKVSGEQKYLAGSTTIKMTLLSPVNIGNPILFQSYGKAWWIPFRTKCTAIQVGWSGSHVCSA